jgi:hypothetical protein
MNFLISQAGEYNFLNHKSYILNLFWFLVFSRGFDPSGTILLRKSSTRLTFAPRNRDCILSFSTTSKTLLLRHCRVF